MKKTYIILVLVLFIVSGQTCKKSEKIYQYINLLDYFPYLTKVYEENYFDFVYNDTRDSRYLLKGFKSYKQKNPKTWAIRETSTITVFISELEDITVTFNCRPLNPPGKPFQASRIFINGHYLQELIIKERGKYHFKIPAALLTLGSNTITYKWKYLRSPREAGISRDKRKYAAGFSDITFLNKPGRIKKPGGINITGDKKNPGINIPPAGIVEYIVNLPDRPLLDFRLSCGGRPVRNAKFQAAIYNKEGAKSIFHFVKNQINPGQEHKIDLSKFAGETVRIVFANSVRNQANFNITLINPIISAVSREGIPLISEIETAGKNIKGKKEKIPGNDKKPNIFIYLIDTLRADHLGCYGYSKETTPRIDSFAKGSILFKKCFANASWTRPAVATILTGLYPNKHRAEERTDKLSTGVHMLPEILKSHGYKTISLTTNGNVCADMNFDQGNDFYKFVNPGQNKENHFHSSEYINKKFYKIIENNTGIIRKPLFAFLHTIDPHDPYTPKAPFLKFKKGDKERENLCSPAEILSKKREKGLTREDIDYIESLYDCEILHNDHYFGKWIEFLKEKKLYDNAIIILISDHGEQFNEHGRMFHGSSIYNEEIHVPLIIKLPHGEYAGRQSAAAVSQVDIVPTILDYLGVETPGNIDGVSVLDLMGNNTPSRYIFIREALDQFHLTGMIDSNQDKNIITYKDRSFTDVVKYEIYNLLVDFNETNNKLDQDNIFQAGAIKFLAEYFSTGIEAAAYKKEALDIKKLHPEVLKQLKALGYLE